MDTIFENGSKQFKYFPNKPERIDYQKKAKKGDIIKNLVLAHGGKVGQPYLEGITVKLEVILEKE
jgi:hypothetical protein